MIAHDGLQGRDHRSKRFDVALNERRQTPHQQQMAQSGRFMLRKGRQGGERFLFLFPMEADVFMVENDKESPVHRKGQAGDHGRNPRLSTATGIQHQTPVQKGGDTNAGTGAPASDRGDLRR